MSRAIILVVLSAFSVRSVEFARDEQFVAGGISGSHADEPLRPTEIKEAFHEPQSVAPKPEVPLLIQESSELSEVHAHFPRSP